MILFEVKFDDYIFTIPIESNTSPTATETALLFSILEFENSTLPFVSTTNTPPFKAKLLKTVQFSQEIVELSFMQNMPPSAEEFSSNTEFEI